MNIKKNINKYFAHTVELRREFHQNPEPSFKEFETAKRIERELKSYNIPYEIIGETGIVATIKGNNDERKIALRADIDALELDDLKERSYKSKNKGLAHACGHDGHMAMLLTAGRILNENKDKINGTILLIFQPAEESLSGAKKMLDEKNFLKDVDGVFGMHLVIGLPTGTIGYCPGAAMASADSFLINIQGKGGHGSSPHMTIDSTIAAAALIMDAQQLVSREISPSDFGVVTFGILQSGTRHNIIADSALIEGTIRTYDEKVRRTLKKGLARITENVSNAYRTSSKLSFPSETSAVVNDDNHLKLFLETAENIVGKERLIQVPPASGSEDFSCYLEKTKGIYVNVGAESKEKGNSYPHHHPKFDLDEDAFPIGIELYIQYALDFLNQ